MQIVISSTKGGSGKSTLAMALADALEANIIDLDPQGTIKITGERGGRHKSISAKQIDKKIVIYDTPPYNAAEFDGLFEVADLILIPCKVSDVDFVTLKTLLDRLRKKGFLKKAKIVFSNVRKPRNKTYEKVKNRFKTNYTDVVKAKTELTQLVGFENILTDPLSGQALIEIEQLLKELKIK